ncbi:helix-turn-helix domain-containing protein [Runella slithyformis]|uniref:Transcriptional regulator, AraC family n=1 Tax=Runella slithyformis (strain ATCC 29530 / DSM 19594 / LMG 11500 / NCIMB 11436 / LSU 4) TaxID=761193 RepID=A0A7U3ZIR6_RUNSL|nr:helix-turn-helix domain-containing protein [Runella slithyformis]AEI47976.1 transcriptional regulator, AraC family [Runella slithyformis DSM 19594]
MSNDKPILNFEGLYGDLNSRYSSEYIFLELITTRSQLFDWVIQPHIHTHLFQLFIVEKGQVTFQNDTQLKTYAGPCIFMIPPTMLHGLTYTPDVSGHILTISETIMEAIFQTSSAVWQSFHKIHIIQNFDENEPFETFTALIKAIEKELFGEYSERDVMLKTYFTQLFVKLHRMVTQGEEQKKDDVTMSHFRKFQKKIKEANAPKSIPEFADELHITPVHLNRICRAVAGKSAIQLVHQNLIAEAQKYLLHTSYSVSEIAYLLKFEYPNYFAKLFKKYVGMSPVEFRQRDRK